MSELKEKYTELKELYRDCRKTIRERDICIDIYRRESGKLNSELDKYRFRIAELQKLVTSLSTHCDVLISRNEELEEENQRLVDKCIRLG